MTPTHLISLVVTGGRPTPAAVNRQVPLTWSADVSILEAIISR